MQLAGETRVASNGMSGVAVVSGWHLTCLGTFVTGDRVYWMNKPREDRSAHTSITTGHGLHQLQHGPWLDGRPIGL